MAEIKISQEMEEECLDAFFCPITREIMVDPVTLISDGHTYEKSAILQWFETGRRISPLTGKRVVSTNTTPNHTLKKAISEYLTKYPEHKKQIMDQKTLLKIIELREKDLQLTIDKNNSLKNNDDGNKNNVEIKKDDNIYNMDKKVMDFLTNINQSKYINIFSLNEIYSMDTVKSLTEDDLKEMIDKVGPRRMIYNAIQKLRDNNKGKIVKNNDDEKKEFDDDIISKKKTDDIDIDNMECVECGIECKSTEEQDEGLIVRFDDNSYVWHCKNCISRCKVCDKKGNKNQYRIIDNELCCDDCYKWCSKHNQRCLKNNGQISFGTESWYCYKCMIQCRCGVWWRPNELNFYPKGSGVNVKCLVCDHDVKL